MLRYLFTVILLGSSLVLLMGCENGHLDNQAPAPVDLSSESSTDNAESSADVQPQLHVAVSAMLSPKETFKSYQQLVNYIGEKLGREVKLRQRKTYKEVNDMLETNQLDVAFICSGAYVRALRRFPLEILVVPVVNDEPLYHSYIIVHKDSKIDRVSQLRGKSFAFTDAYSNSGHLYMADLLKRMGETPETFFNRTIFTYAHDYSIQAVSRKIVDGACVESLIFKYLETYHPERTQDVRIIKVSPGFGIPPVVVPGNLPTDEKNQLRQTFLSMHEDSLGHDILKNLLIDRFELPDLKNYRSVEAMLQNISQ